MLSKLTILVTTLAMTSCASYHAVPLYDPLVKFPDQNEKVTVVSKSFTRKECKKFLDRDVLAKGYQPVQLYIQNDSDKSYDFSLSRISLRIATSEEVAKKVHTSTAGRAIGYGSSALFFWPVALIALTVPLTGLAISAIAIPVVPAVAEGVNSSNANKALDKDFSTKSARDQVILPHSHLNAILFVPTYAYQNSYQLTLIDLGSGQPKTFDVVSNIAS